MTQREVVQIATMPESRSGPSTTDVSVTAAIYALCDDGTLWALGDPRSGDGWKPVKAIPQTESNDGETFRPIEKDPRTPSERLRDYFAPPASTGAQEEHPNKGFRDACNARYADRPATPTATPATVTDEDVFRAARVFHESETSKRTRKDSFRAVLEDYASRKGAPKPTFKQTTDSGAAGHTRVGRLPSTPEPSGYTRADLEAVAQSAAEEGYDTPKQGFVSFAAIAEQVVTGYLEQRTPEKPAE